MVGETTPYYPLIKIFTIMRETSNTTNIKLINIHKTPFLKSKNKSPVARIPKIFLGPKGNQDVKLKHPSGQSAYGHGHAAQGAVLYRQNSARGQSAYRHGYAA